MKVRRWAAPPTYWAAPIRETTQRSHRDSPNYRTSPEGQAQVQSHSHTTQPTKDTQNQPQTSPSRLPPTPART
ncbi:TPA: hypothetical protein ACH3X1_005172 [Trebouxia sp. C0004]